MKGLVLAILLSAAAFAHDNDDHHKPLAVTPEPSTVLLMGAGIAGIGIVAWKRRR